MTDLRKFLMVQVAQNGLALQAASKEMKGDREVVMAAVSQNGYCPAIRHRRDEG